MAFGAPLLPVKSAVLCRGHNVPVRMGPGAALEPRTRDGPGRRCRPEGPQQAVRRGGGGGLSTSAQYLGAGIITLLLFPDQKAPLVPLMRILFC